MNVGLLIIYAQIMLIAYSIFYSPDMDKVLVFFPSISVVVLLIAAFINDVVIHYIEKLVLWIITRK